MPELGRSGCSFKYEPVTQQSKRRQGQHQEGPGRYAWVLAMVQELGQENRVSAMPVLPEPGSSIQGSGPPGQKRQDRGAVQERTV